MLDFIVQCWHFLCIYWNVLHTSCSGVLHMFVVHIRLRYFSEQNTIRKIRKAQWIFMVIEGSHTQKWSCLLPRHLSFILFLRVFNNKKKNNLLPSIYFTKYTKISVAISKPKNVDSSTLKVGLNWIIKCLLLKGSFLAFIYHQLFVGCNFYDFIFINWMAFIWRTQNEKIKYSWKDVFFFFSECIVVVPCR